MTSGMPWPLSVPVLTDGVVTLRAHTPDDVDAMVEMATDPVTIEGTAIPDPYSREDAERFALELVGRGWSEGTHFGWAIEHEGRFAGNVDVRGGAPIADVGYALHPAARGRGLMVRALNLAVDWSFTEAGVEVVHWSAHVGNEASLRVAHRAGFALIGLVPGRLHERGRILDAWTAVRRFGDPPLPRTSWAEARVLETERLRLRPLRDDDVPRIVEACTDPVSRHWMAVLPRPYTEASARAFLAETVWQAAKGTKATWAITERGSDLLVGTIGVMDLHDTTGEIGYWAHPDARGRGLVVEAVRAVASHAFDPEGLGRTRLELYAAAGNGPSNGVAVASGFREVGRLTAAEPLGDGSTDDQVAYELLRP